MIFINLFFRVKTYKYKGIYLYNISRFRFIQLHNAKMNSLFRDFQLYNAKMVYINYRVLILIFDFSRCELDEVLKGENFAYSRYSSSQRENDYCVSRLELRRTRKFYVGGVRYRNSNKILFYQVSNKQFQTSRISKNSIF